MRLFPRERELSCYSVDSKHGETWMQGGELTQLVPLNLISRSTQDANLRASDMPIKSGHPVCAALTPPVGADWYWTLAAVPGK
jgi:hypothetical protein